MLALTTSRESAAQASARRIAAPVAGAALMAWALVNAASGWQAAVARPVDPLAELDRVFGSLAMYLPPLGTVSYLEPDDDDRPGDPVQLHYAAQYALVPRVVQARPGAEFIVVPRGTVRPDADSRLTGFYPVVTLPSGDRLYRRLIP